MERAFAGVISFNNAGDQSAGCVRTPGLCPDANGRTATGIVNPKQPVRRDTIRAAKTFHPLNLLLPGGIGRVGEVCVRLIQEDERFACAEPPVYAQQTEWPIAGVKYEIPQRRPRQRAGGGKQ